MRQREITFFQKMSSLIRMQLKIKNAPRTQLVIRPACQKF